jgi:L-asparaginase
MKCTLRARAAYVRRRVTDARVVVVGSTASLPCTLHQGVTMRTWSAVSIACIAFAAVLAPSVRAAEKQTRPNIVILATGGTIAGAGEAGGHGYTSGQFKVDDLVKAVPGIDKLASLKGEQVANIGSQDMNDQVWLKLATRANELLKRDDVDGIVITHGTDTMEETAYFLDLVLKSEKPVVLVGSMRPATAISADGPGNLWDAVATAANPGAKGRGVLVVSNDTVHTARDVKKMNTTAVETFASPGRGIAGLVVEGSHVRWFEPSDKKHTTASEFSVAGRTTLPRVDIIYAHSNMDDAMIKAALQAGAQGLVIAGVGDGNMSKAALDALAAAAKKGVIIVRSTRLPTGVVLRNAEVNDDEKGFVASGELNPPKSRVLLQLALTEPQHSAKDVQRMFTQY